MVHRQDTHDFCLIAIEFQRVSTHQDGISWDRCHIYLGWESKRESESASKLSYLGEWNESRKNERASGEAARGRGKESMQRSLIKCHLFFAQTKGNTIGWKMTFRKSKLIDNRLSWHPLRLCVKFGSQGDQIGTENLFQPSKQTGSFDVILAKRILRAEDKSDWVCSSVVFVCVKRLV